MGRPDRSSGSHYSQRSPGTYSTHHDSPRRGGLLSNVTLSIGRRLKLDWHIEIDRSEPASATGAKRPETEVEAHSMLLDEIRERISHALWPGAENWAQPMRIDSEKADRREQAAYRNPVKSDASRPVPVNFWSVLYPAERQAFLAVATERTFAAGARLVRERELADHVIVILSGWTKICIEEFGRERVIAERGPGQLVGERGALQVNVRSASVIALETVRALVVRTEQFAEFISAHPRVLDIVEGQVYDRLTEGSARWGYDGDPGASWASTQDRRAADHHATFPAELPRQRLQMLKGQNCTIILTDVVEFGSRTRNDEDRRIIREAILDIAQRALQSLGDVWSWDDRGDGFLAIVSPSVSTARVIGLLLAEIPDSLEQHNMSNPEPARIQLRVGVNVGPISSDRMGLSGEAVIVTARMLDAPKFKDAIAEHHASIGFITSTWVYENVIRHNHNLAGYSEIQVDVKESHIPAWMKLIDKTAPYSLLQRSG